MKTESIEEFLKRGGQISKSNKETSLEELLYTEGMLDHDDAKKVQSTLTSVFNSALDKEFSPSPAEKE